ncbi:MAG TPA: urease accessory protein UreD [Stellaceae bacterium]|nr:urease accessory protein UreD [Stellaceae bacterium]
MSVAILRSDRPDVGEQSIAQETLERGDGRAELRFERRNGATALAHLYQRSPCRILFPNAAEGDLPVAVMVTTSGGLAGGDRLQIEMGAGAGAKAVVTAQAAEKIYRSLGPATQLEIALAVEAGGWLEWLPQETILFEGARLDRRTAAEVAETGRLLACEIAVFGRTARGERFTRGLLRDRWSIRREGKLVWTDALLLEEGIAERLASPFGFDGATALATALYVGPDAAALLPLARALALDGEARAAASLVNGVLLARFLGREARDVRLHLAGYLSHLRRAAAGLPAALPRVWHC